MNMLKMEENHKYRQTIKNVLEFNPEVLKRFVNFMNNPDEKTAVEQFGTQDKYFGACVLLATMPGLPMFGHGQIEGFHEKYGMEPGSFEKFGLDCTLRRMLEVDGAPHRIMLLNALLESAPLTDVFSVSACRKFLDVHQSEGTEWFNKERFEELEEWQAIIGLIDAAALPISSGAVSAAMITAENASNLAAHAGYRTNLYRRMLTGNSDCVHVPK